MGKAKVKRQTDTEYWRERGYVTLFLRVPQGVRDVVEQTVDGMNKARAIGERVHSVNEVVTKCIVEVLSPAFEQVGAQLAAALAGESGPARKPPTKPPAKRRATVRGPQLQLPSGRKGKHSVAAEVTRGGR